MIHIIYIWIIVAALAAGYLVGSVNWYDRNKKNIPDVGYLQFNPFDPAKEFLELHITKDIDIEKPPEYIKLVVFVNEGGKTDGSKK